MCVVNEHVIGDLQRNYFVNDVTCKTDRENDLHVLSASGKFELN